MVRPKVHRLSSEIFFKPYGFDPRSIWTVYRFFFSYWNNLLVKWVSFCWISDDEDYLYVCVCVCVCVAYSSTRFREVSRSLTLRHTTLCRNTPEEEMSSHKGNTQHSQLTDIRAPFGIQIRNPIKRETEESRLIPRCHWDRQMIWDGWKQNGTRYKTQKTEKLNFGN
jgi:hypothetical protein